jgi:hypothetical protein
MKAPIGFITLCEAVDAVGLAVLGTSWQYAIPFNLDADQDDGAHERVITMIAEGCESGHIAVAYRTITGADQLDPAVWRSPSWRNYFDTGTIEVVLPLLDDEGRPNKSGYTARCPREIFVRRNSLDRFIEALVPEVTASRYPGDAALIEEGRQMLASGMTKRKVAEKLAMRAEGTATFESKVDRLRSKF